jgi:NADH-quinone oxidoreductase subunit N
VNDSLLRVAPVAFPIAGSILGMAMEAVFRVRAFATILGVAGLVGSIATALGGAVGAPGFGSEIFALDGAGAVLTAAASAFALASIALAHGYLRPDEEEFPAELVLLLVLVPAGIGLVAGAKSLILVFLGIELLSIPLYALVGLRRKREASIEAAVKYFLLGAFAAGFIAYGLSLVYAGEHTLDVAALRGAAARSGAAATGTALVAAGLLFKISAAPFHFWTPDAYEGAATPVTALMSASTKIAATMGLLLVLPMLPAKAWVIFAVLAILSIAAGNLGALLQDRVKRILAYSSVAHAGTLLLALAAGLAASAGPLAVDLARATREAAVFYLAGYGASVLGAFGVLAVLERGGERFSSIEDFRGLARRQPLAAGLLTFFLLSLAGIPPTAGFFAKYFVFVAAIRADLIGISIVGIVLSVIGVAYYLRIVGTCYMASEEERLGAPPQGRAPITAWLALAGAAAAVVLLGLFPGAVLGPVLR